MAAKVPINAASDRVVVSGPPELVGGSLDAPTTSKWGAINSNHTFELEPPLPRLVENDARRCPRASRGCMRAAHADQETVPPALMQLVWPTQSPGPLTCSTRHQP